MTQSSKLFQTAIAGSLPKPAWLSETEKLWPQWKAQGAELQQAKKDATLLWIKEQEDAGLDIIGDGEQSRQHFVHGFLEQVEGIDFENKVTMGIRNGRYDAQVPQVIAPLRLKGRVHAFEAQLARAHTKKKLKFTLPGPLTIVDTVADRFYGDKVKMAFAFAELLNLLLSNILISSNRNLLNRANGWIFMARRCITKNRFYRLIIWHFTTNFSIRPKPLLRISLNCCNVLKSAGCQSNLLLWKSGKTICSDRVAGTPKKMASSY